MLMEEKAIKIVKSLIDLVGSAAGIVIVAIGGIMFLNALFNLYVFKIESPAYTSNLYKCDVFDVDRLWATSLTGAPTPVALPDSPVRKIQNFGDLSQEDIKKLRQKYDECVKEVKEQERQEFYTNQKRSMATGLAFMIVGFPLIFFYQRRKGKA